MTIARTFVGANPPEEVYDEVTEFYMAHQDDEFRCTPEGIMERKEVFYRHDNILLAVAWNEKDEVVCTFYVSPVGEAYYPVFEKNYGLPALMILLVEAQGKVPVQMWCKPSNDYLAKWVLSTGWADNERYEKEGIITWSSTL